MVYYTHQVDSALKGQRREEYSVGSLNRESRELKRGRRKADEHGLGVAGVRGTKRPTGAPVTGQARDGALRGGVFAAKQGGTTRFLSRPYSRKGGFFDYRSFGERKNMIEIQALYKTFGAADSAVHAVEDVSLDIRAGDVYGIVGYSGAGKSTLVRCINLLERPDFGSIRVEGFGSIRFENGRAFYTPASGGAEQPLTEKQLKTLRRDMGMIFQHFNLLDRSTVFDNIAYPLKHSGRSKAEIRARVLELLELVDLRDKLNSYPSELSGGQKQRVAIARALANNPRVLLSDEATSALDPDATESILRLLKELNQKLDLTIILITHEMAVVKSICSKVAVMEKGRVVEQGNVYDVFSEPQANIRKFVDSSSGLGRINRLIEQRADVLSGGGTLIRLTYNKDCVGDALISEVSRRFGVNMNILLGSLELLQGSPLGGLIVLVEGSMDARREAIAFLCEHNVIVEVIEHG